MMAYMWAATAQAAVEAKIGQAANGSLTLVSPTGQVLVNGQDLLAMVGALTAEVRELRLKLAARPTIRTLDSGIATQYSSLALTPAGHAAVAYFDYTNKFLKLALCGDAMCSSRQVQVVDRDSNVGKSPSMVMSSRGVPVISYSGSTGQPKLAVCNDTLCSVRTITDIDGATVNQAGVTTTSLALTAADWPVIAYNAAVDGVYSTKLAVCSDPTCSQNVVVRTIDSNSNVDSYPSLALTSEGHPRVSFSPRPDSVRSVKLFVCHNADCSGRGSTDTITVYNDTDAGWFNSLALTRAGHPVISFYGGEGKVLWLAVCNDFMCTARTIRTVDVGDVGKYDSLALTAADVPVISYRDDERLDLKLAVCDDPTCATATIRVLDSTGSVGHFISLALTAAGVPVVSYREASSLRLVICGDPSCTNT